MAKTKFVAVVKLDPADTLSTGGVVEWIGHWETDENDDGTVLSQPYQDSSGNIISGYKMVQLSEHDKEDADYPFGTSSEALSVKNPNNVTVGWILQDKTTILRDPNS